ncbi:methyltransferase [Treponema denticola]|uniref:methyltransferase n=1 Tax=Treponema denticola TaxID=158 RepID=UPI002107C7D9|nr:methyltransferase [Treponema denticola]UTY23551.1 hypothetical protein E4N78_04905 [Treponema denticola]
MKKSVRFLSKKSSEYIGEVLLFRKKLSALVNIKELIDSNQEKNTEKLSQNKFFDFAEMAQINIQEILTFRKQTLLAAVNSSCKRGPKNVLDLGGGAGAMLGAIAKQYPCASYTLFERPVVAKIAYDYIKQISLKNTVKIIEGDFLKDDIRNDYDLIIASGIFPFRNLIRNLIKKEDCEKDKKIKKLFLTEKGLAAAKAHEQYHDEHDKVFFDFLSSLNADKRHIIEQFLIRANEMIEHHF